MLVSAVTALALAASGIALTVVRASSLVARQRANQRAGW
jgi:hypothetical protein